MSTVEEDVMAIQNDPKIPGMMLTSNRLVGISAVPIGVIFRETVNHMLDSNVDM